MIFHYGGGGALTCWTAIPGLTSLIDGDPYERWYGVGAGRHFVAESMERRTAELLVQVLGGILLHPGMRWPASHQLNPAKKALSHHDKFELGPSKGRPLAAEGWSVWIESGIWYTAPTVDSNRFGEHAYGVPLAYESGIHDCPCGCSMHDASSWGTCDPFGACPENPRKDFVDYVLHDSYDPQRAWRWAAQGLCPICGSERRGLACLCRFCTHCGCHYLTEIYAEGTAEGPLLQPCPADARLDKDTDERA